MMLSRGVRWSAELVLALAAASLLIFQASEAQETCSRQPTITTVNPPSGSSGTDFRVLGDNLDVASTISVIQLIDGVENNLLSSMNVSGSVVSFTVSPLPTPGLATFTIDPEEESCVPASVEIYVVFLDVVVRLDRDSRSVQPGTVLTTTQACLPPNCGDNSTGYEVYLAGHMLQELETLHNSFVVRLPDTDTDFENSEIFIQTFYSNLSTGESVNFRRSLPITAITPTQGQRGTRVIIEGENLLGFGFGDISLNRVVIGSSEAEIDISRSNSTHIYTRVDSGIPGSSLVAVNTTQTISGTDYDGPYTYSSSLWTQLEDGVVSQIVPPAAQINTTVRLCGQRLLGGGTSIVNITIAEQEVEYFDQVMQTEGSTECIEVRVPDVMNPEDIEPGRVMIESNTGAVVETLSNIFFSYAVITSVSPGRGQVGTEVTITGIGLLSGYPDLLPTVSLAGVEATFVSSSSETIIVRAADPSAIFGSGGSGLVNTFGDVVVTVTQNNTDFHVCLPSSWEYLDLGVIQLVQPDFGQLGTRITLTGTNLLGYGSGLREARVGDTPAEVVSEADDVVVIDAPDVPNLGRVGIVLESDNSAIVQLDSAFEYRARGEITSLNPTVGQNGTFVLISGTNLFGHAGNITTVMFGDLQAEIDFSNANNTHIRVRVQANDVTADTNVRVVITAETMARVGSSGNNWTYLVPGRVDDVQPSIGQNGTIVTITGTNLLGGGSSVQSILLDGVSGTVTEATPTSITVAMDDLSEQNDFYRGTVHIVANTGAVIVGGAYSHRQSGNITGFSPTMGQEGTRITITGTNLRGYGNQVSEVMIAGVQGEIIDQIGNSVVVVRAGPASSGVRGQITLISDTGAIIVSPSSLLFTYTDQGSIDSITPGQGGEGSGILIAGASLRPPGTVITSITIGGSPVSRIITQSESTVSVVVGPAPENGGNESIVVITADDGSIVRGGNFTYLDLTLSLPNLNRGQQGTIVAILLPNDTVFNPSLPLTAKIGEQRADVVFTSASDRRIDVVVPRAEEAGTYTADVTVEGIDGRVARLRNGFTYIDEGVIFTAMPSTGQRGTRVRVRGRNLLGGGTTIRSACIEERSGERVSVNVTYSDDEYVDLEILANLPADSIFPVLADISLTADTGATIVGIGLFTLVQPGQIMEISPTQGQFGTRIRISGMGLLQGGLAEDLDSITVAGREVLEIAGTPSDTEINVRANFSDEVVGPVIITLTTGAEIITPDTISFRYLPPGQIDSVTPDIGTVGTRVAISGSNLLAGGAIQQVRLGGQLAEVFTPPPTDSQITVIAQSSEVNESLSENSTGAVEILIDTGAVILGGEWEFEELGVIESVSPSVGQQGTSVTITGVSLLGSSAEQFSSCSLAGVTGTVTLSSNDRATCVASFNPFATNNSNSTQLSGPVVLVANSGPVIMSNITFAYYPASIDEIDPFNGTNGTFVNITGLNLVGPPENEETDIRSITFGGVAVLTSEVLTRDSVRVRVGPEQARRDLTVRLELVTGEFFLLEEAWNYTSPGEILSVTPATARPGETVIISGINLVPPCVSGVTVIVGQTRSYMADIIDTSQISFQPGPYQESIVIDSNLDSPGMPLPIQLIASNGATVYSDSVFFTYSEIVARVTSVSPLAGSEGDEITIRGTELLLGGNATNVTLAGQNTQIVRASDTEVVVIAGEGPREGASGRVIIESDQGVVSGIGADVWQYLPVLTADDVSPRMGQNGTRVLIDLRGITLVISSVSLAGVTARVVGVSGSSVVVEAGPSSQSTAMSDIQFSFEGGASLTIPSSWSYVEPALVDSLIPDQGYFNTEVRIQGATLSAGGRKIERVYVAGLATTIVLQENIELLVRVSEFVNSSTGPVQGGLVIIWQDGAVFTDDGTMFTYVQLRVSEVSPQVGQGGTVVSITGVGLLAGSSPDQALQGAELGGVATMNTLLLSSTRIDLVASPLDESTTTGNVSYTVANGGTVVIENMWRYLEPGEVREVTPLMAAQGSYVTIRGDRMLQGGATVSQVTIAGVDVMEIAIALDDLIQVRVGITSDLSQGLVTIVADTGAVLENSFFTFQYLPSGTITSISPNFGQNGTRILIMGMGFSEVVTVNLAGVAVNSLQVNDTQIMAEAGRPDIFQQFSGPVVAERASGAIITGGQIFTYIREGVIFSGFPPIGQVGTRVIISGERLFGGGNEIESAYLAGVKAVVDMSNSNDSSVTVVASAPPSSEAITGDIVLVADTGAYVRNIDGWSYIMEGSIEDIAPPRGQFGTRIRITGTGLLSGGDSISQITVGDVETTDIIASSDTVVEARLGQPTSLQPFNGRVTLFSNFGGELRSLFSVQYLEPSIARSHFPTSGVGGTSVNVDGERLLGGGMRIVSVTTAGVPALRIDQNISGNEAVSFTVGYHPSGAAIAGDIVIESDTGALTIIAGGWRYDSACPEGQYGSFGNCANCSEQCVTCDGPSEEDCFECRNFIIPLSLGMRCVERCPNVSTLQNLCVDACNSDQYSRTDSEIDAIFCYECSELCNPTLGCSGPNPTECAGCAMARDTISGACVDSCSEGTWQSEVNECVPCHSQCNATAGCLGSSSSDCYQCLNVQLSSTYIPGNDSVATDVCLEACPSGFYENTERECLPCSEQCLGGCFGPTAFDCYECASVARSQAGDDICVPSCNSGLTDKTLYQNFNGSCAECSSHCSLEEGCTGPGDADCIACRLNRTTNITLPRFEKACVLSCPNTSALANPRPTRFYYHNTMTGACELCDVSCTNGCTGSSPELCLEEEREESGAFSAGPGTIGVTVAVVSILAVALMVLVILMVVFLFKRQGGYKVRDFDRHNGIEMGETRYVRQPNDAASPLPPKNPPPPEEDKGPEEYIEMSPSRPISLTQTGSHSGITMIENQEAIQDSVYSEAGPDAPAIPPLPAKPAAMAKPTTAKPVDDRSKIAIEKPQKGSDNRKSQILPPPVIPQKPIAPSKTSLDKVSKKPAPPPPPPAETDGEMYTEMTSSVQQVYLQPASVSDDQYLEMAHVQNDDVDELVYDDTCVSEPTSPQKPTSDTTPLIDNLYEDTIETVMSPDYQKVKHSMSAASLPAKPATTGPKPLPRSRSSTPLPQTPLEISLQGGKSPVIVEELYVEAETGAQPKEESLYEAITTHSRPLPDEPSPEVTPRDRSRKGSINPPLPPRGQK